MKLASARCANKARSTPSGPNETGWTLRIECAICEEFIGNIESDDDFANLPEVGMGKIAEMFNPQDEDQGGIVHTECGLTHGWAVS